MVTPTKGVNMATFKWSCQSFEFGILYFSDLLKTMTDQTAQTKEPVKIQFEVLVIFFFISQ